MTIEKLAEAILLILRGYDAIDELDRRFLHVKSVSWNTAMTNICDGLHLLADDDELLTYVDAEVQKLKNARRSR